MDELNLKLESFEGPLDLLLHLIKKLEVDIYDIPISEITNQYILYLKQMRELQLDIAGEYLVMASTLMSIKSEWLIPRIEPQISEETFEEDDVDPRKRLADMLIEYQLFKDAADILEEKEGERQELLPREPADLSEFQYNVPLEPGQASLNDLVQAVFRAYRRNRLANPPMSSIEAEEISIDEKMSEIKKKVQASKERTVTFTELLTQSNRREVVTCFLAVLELLKQHTLYALQERNSDEIILRYRNNESVTEA